MKVEIYGAQWCGFCKQAVQLCENNSIEYDYIDVDDSGNMRALNARLDAPPKTVPQIFIDGEYLSGGFTGLRQYLIK